MDTAEAAPNSIALINKTDLGCAVEPSDLYFEYVVPVCAKTGEGLDLLESALDFCFPEDEPCDGSILTNARQAEAAGRALNCVVRANQALSDGVTPDALLTDVEEALEALGELTGQSVREDVTDRIFSKFCVGK